MMTSSIEVPREVWLAHPTMIHELLDGYTGPPGHVLLGIHPDQCVLTRPATRIWIEGPPEPVRYMTARLMAAVGHHR